MNEDIITIPPELLDKVVVWRDVMRTMRDEDVEEVLYPMLTLEIKQRAELRSKIQVEAARRAAEKLPVTINL